MALSAYDQAVYDAGYKYIPQSQYLLNPFQIPTTQAAAPTISGGLTTIPVSMGGEDNSNPYRLTGDIRTDYNPFPARQAAEMYSRTFNPQSTFDPNLVRAQNTANLIRTYESGTGPGVMRLGNTVLDVKDFSPAQRAFLKESADDFIDDARMQYATEGQFVDPYDPVYSSETEAQKFMDNYPEYYGVNRRGIELPGILGVGQDFLKSVIPINERAIMENEARGAGIYTDDIGRIVGDPSTAGGIMAGYNLNKIDAGTFDKRRARIEKTIADKKAKGLDTTALEERLGLLDEAEEDILGARKTTQQIYKMRKDRRIADQKRREAEAAAKKAAAKKAAEEAERRKLAEQKAEAQRIQDRNRQQRTGGYQYGTQGGGGGAGRDFMEGPSGRDRFSGDTDLSSTMGSFAYGGRVPYMMGGLADLVDIYD
tara:strand:- start:127 stop:1401 length:1275 start_codon:yes stop_codon:yes gene_type:complete